MWRVSLVWEILVAYRSARSVFRGPLPEAVEHQRKTSRVRGWRRGTAVEEGVRLAMITSTVLRALPTDGRCLVRSLVVIRLLSERHIDSTLVIGVKTGDAFSAHAWVEVADIPLIRGEDLGFARLTEA